MRLEKFIRDAIIKRGIYKHRHTSVITTLNNVVIQDYDTTVAIADRISRIAIVDAEHYTPTTAKTITYVFRALDSRNYAIYEAPFIDYQNTKFILSHRYDLIGNQPVHIILLQNEKGTHSTTYVYNWSLLRKNLEERAFIYSKMTTGSKKLYEFPTPAEMPRFPFDIEPTKEQRTFEFSARGIPATIDDFRPASALDKLSDELFFTIDHLISKNLIKFTKFSVIDDNTIIVRRVGGLLKKFSNFEKIKIDYDAIDYSLIIPKINHVEIPLLSFEQS